MEDHILSEHMTADHQAKSQQENTDKALGYYLTSNRIISTMYCLEEI